MKLSIATIFVFIAMSFNANAENWVKLNSKTVSEMHPEYGPHTRFEEMYLDTESIRRNGEKYVATIVENTNIFKGNKANIFVGKSSYVNVEEFDCLRGGFRILRFGIFPNMFGKGEQMHREYAPLVADTVGIINYAVPGENEYFTLNYLCKK